MSNGGMGFWQSWRREKSAADKDMMNARFGNQPRQKDNNSGKDW